MQQTNEQVVLTQKAAIDATNTLASQGRLPPKQANTFLDFVIDITGLKNNCRIVRFDGDKMIIDKIGVGRRVAMPKAEGRDPGLRRGVTTSKVEVITQEIMVPFEITDIFDEVNLEGMSVEDHILRMMTTQLGNDAEELYIGGDTLGVAATESEIVPGGGAGLVKDTYLALLNGFLRLADSGHVVDLSALTVGSSAFSKVINAMPSKYKRSRANLRNIVSIDSEQNYREKVGGRMTAMGDAALQGDAAMKVYGIPIMPFPLFPHRPRVVQHVQLNGTTPVSLRYKGIENVVVTTSTLGSAPESAYLLTTDYTLDTSAGTITRAGGGDITDGQTVKVTYDALPQILCTHFQNLIVGFSRDIRIEKDRDIYKGVNQYAITFKVGVAIEEVDAVVKGINLALGA